MKHTLASRRIFLKVFSPIEQEEGGGRAEKADSVKSVYEAQSARR